MDDWNPSIDLIEGEVHRKFLRKAYLYAQQHSDDPNTQTGAIIVSPSLDQIIAYGANHFPEGLNPTAEQAQDRTWKYEHMIHAEVATIFDAAKKGSSTQDAVMYMPWIPCTPCARAIIDSGIKTLIGHKSMIMKTPERWWKSTNYALDLLKKCGVKYFMYDGDIGQVTGLFNGLEWRP